MAEAVAQGNLIVITELVVKTRRRQVQAAGVREQAAVSFKLIHQESLQWAARIVDRKDVGKNPCAGGRGESRLAGEARHRRCTKTSQTSDDRLLIVRCRRLRPEDAGVVQERNCVLSVAHQTFKSAVKEGFVFGDRKTDGAAELLACEGVLNVRALKVWLGGIENLPRSKRLADGKGIRAI